MAIRIGNKRRGDVGENVGRPSVLGNPFVVGKHGTRKQCVALYREHFTAVLLKSDNALAELDRLLAIARNGNLTLLCWCAPLECHAEVIREYLTARVAAW